MLCGIVAVSPSGERLCGPYPAGYYDVESFYVDSSHSNELDCYVFNTLHLSSSKDATLPRHP